MITTHMDCFYLHGRMDFGENQLELIGKLTKGPITKGLSTKKGGVGVTEINLHRDKEENLKENLIGW